jgi:hypothetical protein
VGADRAVVLDACVLAEAAVTDLILRLAAIPNLVVPRWSVLIWDEANRTCVNKLGWEAEIGESRMRAAVEFFPEAMIEGFEELIPKCENHPLDRHVLAAAIQSRTPTILTFNVKDFKPPALERWGIVATHPAEFLKFLYDQDSVAVMDALESMAIRSRRSLPEVLGRLAWHARPFSEYVASVRSLELPNIAPIDWRR